MVQTEISSYFTCEQNGHNPSNPCDQSGYENLTNQLMIIALWSRIILFFAPAVNVVFVVDCQEMKKMFKDRYGSRVPN